MTDVLWQHAAGVGRRMWEIRHLEYCDEIIDHPVQEVHAQRGLVFNSSTGVLTTAKSGYLKAALANPATATRLVFLYRMTAVVATTKSDLLFFAIRINPATAGLTSRAPGNARIGSQEKSSTVLYTGVGPEFTGGAQSQSGFPIMTGTRTGVELAPLIIPPGVTFGISGPLDPGATAALTFWWYESLPALAAT
jgi:hypothetical protein